MTDSSAPCTTECNKIPFHSASNQDMSEREKKKVQGHHTEILKSFLHETTELWGVLSKATTNLYRLITHMLKFNATDGNLLAAKFSLPLALLHTQHTLLIYSEHILRRKLKISGQIICHFIENHQNLLCYSTFATVLTYFSISGP